MIASRVCILVADDEESIRSYVKDALGDEGYRITTASGGREALEAAEKEDFHLVLLDMVMPDLSGIEVLRKLKEKSPAARVIIMTAFGTIETAVESMREGAVDYLTKPVALEELKFRVRRAVREVSLAQENRALRRQVESGSGVQLLGHAPAFLAALGTARKVAGSDATVLVTGETGTGKELVARMIHLESSRREGPFLAVNCAAMPESLLERELFGHEKGAFTGADSQRPGLLEAAADGTLLLDEVAEMAHSVQAKLLRVLEGHEFMRIGGTKPLKSHVRFIAATNQDLERGVKEKRLREDLYYRLNVVTVKLPALRERGDDVLLLAEHFLVSFIREHRSPIEGLTQRAAKALQDYTWPGNVRELRNVIERAVLVCSGGELDAGDLKLAAGAAPGDEMGALAALPYRQAKAAFEKAFLGRVLSSCGGNISEAAKRLGMFRQNLQTRLKKLGIRMEKA